jgi:hypothetical protein
LVGCAPRPAGPPVAAGAAAVRDHDASDDGAGYTISGTVRDTSRRPVPGARIEVMAPGFEGRFATSDSHGWYRIAGLAGGVQLQASRAGYFADARSLTATERTLINFTLQPVERIDAGVVVQSTLTEDDPQCASVPCRRYLFLATANGTLEIVMTCDAQASLALDIIAPDGQTSASLAGASRIETTLAVQSGSTYELRVLANARTFANAEDFELTARMK